MNKIYFMFLFFIKAESINFDELPDLKVNIKLETINDSFKKCAELYYEIFNEELLFQDYKECLLSNLDDLESVHKYLIFNELFFQKFNVKLSKENLKKYLVFVYDKNDFDNELKNFQILIEVLSVYEKEKKELNKNDFFILLSLIHSLDEEKNDIINFYSKLNNKKILKIKEILNNDQNFLNVFKILIRWKCDLDSSWINKFFLQDLLIAENYFKKNKKILSYLEFETLQNKKNASNLSITQLLLSENELDKSDDSNVEVADENIEHDIENKKEQKNNFTKINMNRNENKEVKKLSVINVETGSENKQYIIESSKNDRLIIKIKNNSCENKDEKIDIKDKVEKKIENDKNHVKNKQSLFKGSFVIGIFLILFL